MSQGAFKMRIQQSQSKVLWYTLDSDSKIVCVSWTKEKAIMALRELSWREAGTYESIKHKDIK